MRNLINIFFSAVVMMVVFESCNQSTGSDSYDSLWSPSGDSKNTSWIAPSGVEFSQVDRGFQFTPTFDTTSGGKAYLFTPSIYQVTNITTAEYATVSFKARIVTPPDSIDIVSGGKTTHQFGVIEGTVEASGDSVNFSTKSFTPNVENTITFSTNPDSISKILRFRIIAKWDSVITGTHVNPLPTSKKITVEVSDIVMKVYKISVLK
ncbi:MAG: hypothetical protein H3C35_00795 [Bacteroidetes bacterium]|nr:hypothetical protein [Bacteroidota bacterium]